MSDYIKREDALKAVDAFIGTDPIAERIKLIPSVDVAPVRHGRWEDYEENTWQCSECGEQFYLEDGTPQENEYRYCPNCGARMDGEENV